MARILISESDDDLRLVLRVLLHREGHQVLEARDGREALRLLLTETVDLAVVEIGLTQLDGHDVLRTVRDQQPTGRPTLVALYGLGDLLRDRGVRQAYVSGADDVLTKPFVVEDLVDRLRMHLDERQVAGPPPW
ncbi:response regulator [Nocardioides bruguierae]|uniref:Response regulator n=1 Tax=Nocardioides bruguierae TaxID=2945102 RepID=A0A9X2DAE9_9ACTN|nr:response regulator [Nocardioides bruguierae]MCL8027167.1 response regulator [Nocardioides bruguierae]MCM0622320.1 response regulator [Nocardioides bruguierae]